MHAYQAFGMQICSEMTLSLPDLSVDSAQDWPVSISYGRVEHDSSLASSMGRVRYGKIPDGIQVEVPWAARFRISGDSQIAIDPAAGATEESIALYLIGLVLPFLLRSRPLLTLHGSAVSGEWGALAFVGHQGSGKSTTVAALAGQGYKVLCDDVIPVASGPRVFPGISLPKLLPDAYQHLVGDPAQARHLFDGVDKFQVNLGGASLPADLRALFILAPGGHSPLQVKPLKGGAKLRALLEHVATIDGLDDRSTQFARCSDRLGPVPVFQIQRPLSEFCLSDIVGIITKIDQKRMLPCFN